MRFDLVIFDCDGVLVETERLTVGLEARVLTELGWPHTPEEVVARFMGRTSAYQLQVLERRLGPERTRLFEETTRAELEAAFASELTAVEGVEALLDELQRAGQPTCVASSGTHERMRTTLGLTGLEARFEGRVFSATQVAHGKPAPDLFLYAAEQMGASPSRCAVIEDSVFGVQAALAAGMTAFGYEGGLAPAGSLAEAGAQVFAHMSDLRDLLVGSRSPAG